MDKYNLNEVNDLAGIKHAASQTLQLFLSELISRWELSCRANELTHKFNTLSQGQTVGYSEAISVGTLLRVLRNHGNNI